ncbi:MAG: class I SAM-dependent RNA methyltransferase [Hyphomicrobiaceae bacterium]
MTVEIAGLGAQGDGIARTDAGDVFVPGALPGETVEIERSEMKVQRSRIVVGSPDRQTAPCPHFGTCGGCVSQHMAASLYAAWKRDSVVKAFAHRGLEPPVAPLVTIPAATRRRIVLEARRAGEETLLGFHAHRSHTLVDIRSCDVMLPSLQAALPGLKRIAAQFLARDGKLRMTVTATSTGLDIAVEGPRGNLPAGTRATLAACAAAEHVARMTLNGEIIVMRDRPVLKLGPADVELLPGSFIQATAEAEAAMTSLVMAAAGKAKRIADLFCGLGTFTFPLARRARVFAVDAGAEAIAALSAAAARTGGCKPIETRVRDLLREPLSRKELETFDAVVLDPPRAGAQAQSEALAKSAVPVIVAVSCNPATLARDARLLVDGGYAIEAVTPIDQFVWSAQVEAVAVLRRGRK